MGLVRRSRVGLAICTTVALLLALAGIGLLGPNGAQAAGPFTFSDSDCTAGNMSSLVQNLKNALSNGQSVEYTGTNPCTVKLGGVTLTPKNGASVTIEGGVGLALDGQQYTGSLLINFETTSSSSALTLNHVTLENGFYGIYAVDAGGTLTVSDSTISGTVYGILAAGAGGTIAVSNSTFSGNSAYGIYAPGASGTISVSSTTIGGGEYSIFAPGASGVIRATATILAGSTVGNCTGTIVDGGYNLSTDGTCAFTPSTANNVSGTQLNLQPLADNGGPTQTQALGSGTVAIDAIPVNGQGDCTVGEPTDQRGVVRPQGSGCDIGAFEVVQSTNLSVCPDQPRLQSYLDSAPADGSAYVITLPPNCTVTLADHGLTVGAGVNITLQGNGLTVDGQSGSFDIIDVNDSNSHPSGLALDQVTLQNGASGVVEAHGTGTVLLIDSTIRNMTNGNQISYGVDANTVSLTRSTVSGITGTAGATAYAVSGISVTLNASTISGVSGSNSAAGVFALGSASVTNSTISGIASSGSSFGVLTLGSGAVTSSTITQVTASGAGSPAFGVANGGSSLTLQASLLANNGSSCGGSVIDGGYNLSTDTSCNFPSGSTSKVVSDSDVNLQPLANNGGPTETIALGPGSVAIDAIPVSQGQCVAGVSADQRGVARPQGPGCDIGAYETTNSASLLPGSTTTVRQGFYALIRIEALGPAGQNISRRNLPVTSVELDGPNDQVIPFAHQLQFGRFSGQPGYQLSINTRNLAKGDWTLVVQIGSGQTATTGWVMFTVQ